MRQRGDEIDHDRLVDVSDHELVETPTLPGGRSAGGEEHEPQQGGADQGLVAGEERAHSTLSHVGQGPGHPAALA